MNETVGDKIKNLRRIMGISQKALAHNICNQSEISRVENNQYKPSYQILFRISERLGVDVNFFLEETENRSDYMREVKFLLNKARRERDYETILEIVDGERSNPLFKKRENWNYLMWNKGIMLYHLFNQKEEAIKVLLNSLSDKLFENLYKELDINILSSIGIIHRNEGEPNEGLKYLKKAFDITEKLKGALDIKLVLKVYYNLSKIYTDIGNLDSVNESVKLCKKGIKKCIECDCLFLLADFHYQIGRNYLKHLSKEEQGLKYWYDTLFINKIEGKTKLVEIVKEEIRRYVDEGRVD